MPTSDYRARKRIYGRVTGSSDTGDFWRKGWYRIQDGSVHLRNYFYGPGLGMIVCGLSSLGGTINCCVCNECCGIAQARDTGKRQRYDLLVMLTGE